jgi:hypothetical protein
VGADVVRTVRKAASGRCNRSGGLDPTGVLEQGMGTLGFPRNVGGPVVSRPQHPDGGQPERTQPLAARVRARRGAERRQAQGGYRQAKATKRGGMDGGMSEQRVVLWKQGNPGPRETLWKEGAAEAWHR